MMNAEDNAWDNAWESVLLGTVLEPTHHLLLQCVNYPPEIFNVVTGSMGVVKEVLGPHVVEQSLLRASWEDMDHIVWHEPENNLWYLARDLISRENYHAMADARSVLWDITDLPALQGSLQAQVVLIKARLRPRS